MPEINNPAWSEEKAELLYNLRLADQDGDEAHVRACLRQLEALEEAEGEDGGA